MGSTDAALARAESAGPFSVELASESAPGVTLLGDPPPGFAIMAGDDVFLSPLLALGAVVAVEANPAHDLLVLDNGALVTSSTPGSATFTIPADNEGVHTLVASQPGQQSSSVQILMDKTQPISAIGAPNPANPVDPNGPVPSTYGWYKDGGHLTSIVPKGWPITASPQSKNTGPRAKTFASWRSSC